MRQNQACECNFHCGCTSGDYVGCIKSVPIFSNLSKDEMQEISHITDAVTFKKGEMVYMAGDEGGMLYVLHTGRIKISRISYGGKEQVIRVISPGDFIGELSLLRAR